ncbi:MAG: PilC/PilY family type IV pilus protein [Gallionella sp.]
MTTIDKFLRNAGTFLILAAVIANAHATDIAQGPLVTSSSSTQPVKPNVFLMMDDSGSMGWDYMPDDVSNFQNNYGFYSAQCNGVYYDPSLVNTPPIKADGVSHYPDVSFTAAPWDGYGVDKPLTTVVNLDTSFVSSNYYSNNNYGGLPAARAFYYTYSGTQLTNAQQNYTNTSGTFYKECNSSIGSAPGNAVFKKHILGTTETTTIAISGSNSTSVSGITVNGKQIMSASSGSATTSSSTLATNIRDKINLCTSGATGNCSVGVSGYSATVSGSTVTITGPTSAADFTPVISQSGSMTLTTDVFPITTASSLTNFADWYSYYRTRINMMKTSTGLAFKNIDGNYRVGFATMNNNTGSDMLNLAPFIDTTSPTTSTQRTDFYAKLYATQVGSSTPLLQALSEVGLLYGHKLPGNKLNSVAANDPIEYSCQQNFTILSTDGYWNDNTNMTLKAQGSGSKCSPDTSHVGNCDSPEPRPMFDGGSVTTVTATPTTTVDQIQSVTNYTTTTPWTQTVTTVGAPACSIAAPPSGATSSYMSDSVSSYYIKVSLSLSASNPATDGSCYRLSASTATTKAWLCDGTYSKTSPTNPPDNNSFVTDSAGKTWFLVSRSSNLGTGCVSDNTAFTYFSSNRGACVSSGTSGTGQTVTTQLQTATETTTGTTTSVDNASTTVTSTVTSTDGLAGAPVITTSPTTYTNVSSVSTVSSDTTSAYTNTGSPVISCSSTAVAGTSTPVAGSGTSSGTPTTTTLSSASTVGTPVVTTTSSGGTSNTLADVAEYYYITDIRDSSLSNQTGALGTDVTKNNVPSSGLDAASWQHMTTFTLGLGARGKMVFSPSYKTDSSGDFYDVKNGTIADPANGICSWQSGGKCNWPVPPTNGGDQTTIDDLWHAAVDGRGSYYSATNPSSLSTGLDSALAGVSARTGSSASASISNPNISTGDNFIFSSNFQTQDWYGRLVRQQLDLNTGALSPVIDWEAGALLDTNTSRNIYAYSSAASNHMQTFNAANFGSSAYFASANISSLSQIACPPATPCLTTTQQSAAAGAPLVSYLAGDHTNEGFPLDSTKYYRQRVHLLGDIVDSQATYVKAPLLLYSDAGYSDFVAAKADRQSMIYVGANDGMLHAFYANTDIMDNVTGDVATSGTSVNGGQEAWAYIPTAVMPNLYKLADIDYASKHQYFVDGSPVSTDICPTAPATPCSGTTSTTTTWKTILVSGLNAGGNSYFAMDITNPAAPKVLWEFTNANLGYSYGNPQIVKLGGSGTGSMAAGTWVVLLTSGYNNADGQGHLFVLNAYTGALLLDLSTGVGSPSNPSGLAKIVAQVVNPSLDATVQQVYGGDLFGNVWRFDINGNVGAAGNDAQLLAVLKGPNGVRQPITSKPEVGIVNGKVMVYVGTGRYLGLSDIDGTDTSQLSPNLQSMYGIMDPLLTTTTPSVAIYDDPRNVTTNPFVQQTEFTTVCPSGAPATVCTYGQVVRTSTNNPVNIPTNSGWYLDFPDSGERVNTDPALELGLLAFNSNVPSANVCSIGGDSYNYVLDYTTGAFPSNSVVTIDAAFAATLPPDMVKYNPSTGTYTMGVVAGGHTGSLSTAPIFISLPNGNKALCTNDSTGQLTCRPVNAPPPSGGARRVSWRELLSQ